MGLMVTLLILISITLIGMVIELSLSYSRIRVLEVENTKLTTFKDCFNNLFNKLVEVSEKYKTDGTAPGLVISYLPDAKTYYASIIRYLYPKGEGKRVVCSYKGDKFDLLCEVFDAYDKNKDADVEKRYSQYLDWRNLDAKM